MPDKPPVTLADLARHLGMSKSTVQRALVHAPRCSPETAKRVREAAKAMGYRPDPVFAAMGSRRGRRSMDGMPLAYVVHGDPNQPILGGAKGYLKFLEERAKELGYRIEVINLAEWPSPSRFWKILYARGIVGVLFGAVRPEDTDFLSNNDLFPAVCVGRTQVLPYNSVRPAILTNIHGVWQRMLQHGYKRIGAAIMRHEPMLEDDFSRLASVLACQQIYHPDFADHIPPFFETFGSEAKIVDWVKKHKPDVVLGFHVGLYFEIKDAGINIPKDVGFACLHLNSTTDDPLTNEIAGTSQNQSRIAYESLELIDQMIRHGQRGLPEFPISIIVPPVWQKGRSLRSQFPASPLPKKRGT